MLRVSFVGYELFEKQLIVTRSNLPLELGRITLRSAAKHLSEVMVEEERIPIQFKVDTLEYDALSFKTRPNGRG